jgi:hypothetical protein
MAQLTSSLTSQLHQARCFESNQEARKGVPLPVNALFAYAIGLIAALPLRCDDGLLQTWPSL